MQTLATMERDPKKMFCNAHALTCFKFTSRLLGLLVFFHYKISLVFSTNKLYLIAFLVSKSCPFITCVLHIPWLMFVLYSSCALTQWLASMHNSWTLNQKGPYESSLYPIYNLIKSLTFCSVRCFQSCSWGGHRLLESYPIFVLNLMLLLLSSMRHCSSVVCVCVFLLPEVY